MIRRCTEQDIEAMYEIINDAAIAYRGIIPEDRWHEREHPQFLDWKSAIKWTNLLKRHNQLILIEIIGLDIPPRL